MFALAKIMDTIRPHTLKNVRISFSTTRRPKHMLASSIATAQTAKMARTSASLPLLKMVDLSGLGQYVDYGEDGIAVTKFKKGQTPDPEDNNALLDIKVDADAIGEMFFNSDKCTWTQTPCTRSSDQVYEYFLYELDYELFPFCSQGQNGTLTSNEKSLSEKVLLQYLNELAAYLESIDGSIGAVDEEFFEIEVVEWTNSEDICGTTGGTGDTGQRQLQNRRRSRGKAKGRGRCRRCKRRKKKRMLLEVEIILPDEDRHADGTTSGDTDSKKMNRPRILQLDGPPDLVELFQEADEIFENITESDVSDITYTPAPPPPPTRPPTSAPTKRPKTSAPTSFGFTQGPTPPPNTKATGAPPTPPPSTKPTGAPTQANPEFENIMQEIEDATDPNEPAEIILPAGTLEFASDIVLSGKYFTMTCPDGEVCELDLSQHSFVSNFSNRRLQDPPMPFMAEFVNITMKNGSVGAIKATGDNSSEVILEKCTLIDNECNGDGGAIKFSGGTLQVIDCLFERNKAEGKGGAIWSDATTSLISNSVFSSNESGDSGGALHIADSFASISDSNFTCNEALAEDLTYGGAICLLRTSNGSAVQNVLFKGNGAVATRSIGGPGRAFGGALSILYCQDMNVTGCTFESNSCTGVSEEDGGGIFYDNAFSNNYAITDTSFQNNAPNDVSIAPAQNSFYTCGDMSENCFCNAVTPGISTNNPTTTCAGAGIGPSCPKCSSDLPYQCPTYPTPSPAPTPALSTPPPNTKATGAPTPPPNMKSTGAPTPAPPPTTPSPPTPAPPTPAPPVCSASNPYPNPCYEIADDMDCSLLFPENIGKCNNEDCHVFNCEGNLPDNSFCFATDDAGELIEPSLQGICIASNCVVSCDGKQEGDACVNGSDGICTREDPADDLKCHVQRCFGSGVQENGLCVATDNAGAVIEPIQHGRCIGANCVVSCDGKQEGDACVNGSDGICTREDPADDLKCHVEQCFGSGVQENGLCVATDNAGEAIEPLLHGRCIGAQCIVSCNGKGENDECFNGFDGICTREDPADDLKCHVKSCGGNIQENGQCAVTDNDGEVVEPIQHGRCIGAECVTEEATCDVNPCQDTCSMPGFCDEDLGLGPGYCVGTHCNVYCIGKAEGAPCQMWGKDGTCGNDEVCYLAQCGDGTVGNEPCNEDPGGVLDIGPGRCVHQHCFVTCNDGQAEGAPCRMWSKDGTCGNDGICYLAQCGDGTVGNEPCNEDPGGVLDIGPGRCVQQHCFVTCNNGQAEGAPCRMWSKDGTCGDDGICYLAQCGDGNVGNEPCNEDPGGVLDIGPGRCVHQHCFVTCNDGQAEGAPCRMWGQDGTCGNDGVCYLSQCSSLPHPGYECNEGIDIGPGHCEGTSCNVYCDEQVQGDPCKFQGQEGICGLNGVCNYNC